MPTVLDRLSPLEQELIRNATRSRGDLKEVCERLGLNYHSIRGALSRAQARDSLHTIAGLQPASPDEEPHGNPWPALREQAGLNADRLRLSGCPPPIVIIEEPKPLKLTKWLYAADQHAPLHDDLWIERLCRVAYHEGVEDLVLGGDFFDNDSLSAHPADLPQIDLNTAIEVAGQVLRYIKSHVKTIHILPGNHCRRMAKALNKNLSFKNFVRMTVGDLEGFNVTELDYFYVNDSTPERPGWSVGHPRFFAAYPTKGLDAVALQRQRHVIGAHSHTLGATKIGPYWCISPGMMMRADLTPYLVRSNGLSKHADQARGFVLVESTRQGDLSRLFADGLTYWPDYN